MFEENESEETQQFPLADRDPVETFEIKPKPNAHAERVKKLLEDAANARDRSRQLREARKAATSTLKVNSVLTPNAKK